MLPAHVREEFESAVGRPIRNVESVSGGCIGQATKVDTDRESFFVKWGQSSVSDTFRAEAQGLEELRKAATVVRIPHVIACTGWDGGGMLVLEWIEATSLRPACWRILGEGLAEIHSCTRDTYGFDSNNYIGATPQINRTEDDWHVFFREHRTLFQVDLARKKGHWKAAWDGPLNRVLAAFESVIPKRPAASLVHGDLWLGNMLSDANGTPVVIDPAVYYGHSEVDVGMMKLFGSPPESFFDAYDRAISPEPGREIRLPLYNLYHLINHLNLFGAGYASSVEAVLSRY